MIVGLTTIALLVRLVHLNSTDIAGDEPFSVFVAQLEPDSIIRFLSKGNNPPLFEILLHYWVSLFGNSDFSLRLPPTLISSLTVIPIFLTGKRFFNSSVAVMAGVFFSFSIFHIRFAHEVRVYSLFSLATAWSLYFFLSLIRKPDNRKVWMWLALSNVILLYSHFTSFYILLVEVVCGLLFIKPRYWKSIVIPLTVSALLYLPYLFYFLQRLGEVSSNGTWVRPPGWGEIYGSVNLLLNSRVTTVLILMSLAAGFVVQKRLKMRDFVSQAFSNKTGQTVLLWFAIPYILMFLVSITFIPMFIDRYILYTSIPLFLSIGWATTLIWERTDKIWLGTLLVCSASIVTTNPNPSNHRKIKSTVSFIERMSNDRTQVYICPAHFSLAFAFHYDRSILDQLASDYENPLSAVDKLLNEKGIFPINTTDSIHVDKANKVIYMDADSKFVLPGNGILETLQSQLTQVDSAHFHQIFDVYVFENPN